VNETRVKNLLEDALFVFCAGEAPTKERVAEFLRFVRATTDDWETRDFVSKPCCSFFNVDNLIYKDVYLPGIEEFVAHGYKRELYEEFLASWKKNIDEHGRP